MRALLIDLDGVLYQGDDAVPGAAAAVEWIVANKIPHVFLTNTTSRPRRALVKKLRGFGIDADDESLLTPPRVTCGWLATHAPGPAALFVPKETRTEFADLPRLRKTAVRGAASVVIGDIGEQWTFAELNRAFRLLMEEPAPVLVALGMTRYWRAPEGLRLDVAPFVKALEHASGRRAVVLGKPSDEFFRTALAMLGCEARDTYMIGDDIVGDVQGSQRLGIRGVLVRTGKFRPQDLRGDIRPETVLDSIAELPGWWRTTLSQRR